MSFPHSSEISPGKIRAFAIALFGVISGSLWIGFSLDTYFASDGCFYFAIILDNGTFTYIAPSRLHAEYLTQWPLVCGVRSGITDLGLLEVLFGLGIWFPWVLSFVISLYATRERPELIFLFLISLVSLNLAAWSLIYGEHMVLLSLAWPIFYIGILRRPLHVSEQILTGLLLIAHLKLYESTVATGSIFVLLFGFRTWLAGSKRERVLSAAFTLLALGSVLIALYWIIFPRDSGNRDGFLTSIIASLGHPYPWMGLSFVVLNIWGVMTSSSKLLLAAWVAPLVMGVFAVVPSGIHGGLAFSTRTLTLTALPLLLLATLLVSLSSFRFERKLFLSVSALIVGISLLQVRHLQAWWEFQRDFKAILSEEVGFVKAEDYPDTRHWGWTNTILSYVWSEGEVKAVILNPTDTGYEPFPVKTEMLLEKYLTKKPDFLEEPE
jgi:hypothetical protein